MAIFGWRAVHNLLPTRAAISTKGYSGDLRCVVCSSAVEHLFCQCNLTREIIGASPFFIQLSSLSWKEWFLERVTSMTLESFDKLLVLLWSIWKNRNDKLWRDRSQTGPRIVASTMAWFDEYSRANRVSEDTDRSQPVSRKKWTAPVEDVLKLNVDGAFLPSIPYGGTCGVIRNAQGLFIAEYSYRSAFYGLELLLAVNITKAVVESDCLVAVQATKSLADDLSDLGALISEIKGLVAAVGEVTVCFANRQANMVAHRLASHSFDSNIRLDWFTNAQEFILDDLMYDHHRI
ncbi:uncharacterized protein LOC133737092 [Rosa rugosa]|uniref:uncharacterized protein LOC133737092 n=1 Tax=Rosa rugosa TaxID=74645 RepID=UPI002B4185D0|nr:uncharacterized protein LOC133737092 [Rosa rugosa]